MISRVLFVTDKDDGHHRPFLALWVLAVGAAVLAFCLHLAMRGKTMQLGYELGKARSEQARLREVRRVLELEAASYETPQRVEVVARQLLAMAPPAPDHIISMAPIGATSAAAALPTDPKVATPTSADSLPPIVTSSAAPLLTAPLLPNITPPKTAAAPIEPDEPLP